MEYAKSLSTGKTYEARKVNYAQAKTLKLVCPVCKEKVFKRVRHIPQETHMFAHHKGGSLDCELYFPATTDGPSRDIGLGISRGQTFEQFIKDIDADLRELLAAAKLIPERGFDEKLLQVIVALVAKESGNLSHLLIGGEVDSHVSKLVDSSKTSVAKEISHLILGFYARDGARFIDALFCQWVLYCIRLKNERADIAAALNRLVQNGRCFSAFAGKMLAGLALLYSHEDLNLFRVSYFAELDQLDFVLNDDAKKYFGELKNGKFHGLGVMTWPDGKKYVGEFKDGEESGQGVSMLPTGEKYVGAWEDGVINGLGVLIWPDGEKYVGDFIDGAQHGQGTLFGPAGDILYSGRWEWGERMA